MSGGKNVDKARLCEEIIFSEKPGLELKRIREQKGILQKTMAKKMGETPQALSKKETQHDTVTVNTIKKFLKAMEELEALQMGSAGKS